MPGGDVERVSRAAHFLAHGQHSGRWSRSFRAERAMRAGTLISVRRIVWVTARPTIGLVVASCRVEIYQGAHVGRPSLLTGEIPRTGGIIVSGTATRIS